MAEGKKLLVVESPAKAKTINKFLGAGFTIKASMGHVRDIPHKAGGDTKFGIDINNNYQPVYEPLKTREKTLREIAAAAKNAEAIYLAPDPDREGEAIAWHLKEALKLPENKTFRVTFNAITKKAVQDAMANPTKINMDLVNAQQGRRVLDRLVGFSLSPFLWKKVTKGLSAGRVQSVAVRVLVEREREIRAFKAEEYWKIIAELSAANSANSGQKFTAQLVKWKNEKFILGNPAAENETSVKAISAQLENAKYQITNIEQREVKSRPSPAFITSTLQQSASTFLYFGAKKTMMVAQKLYEGIEVDGNLTGLITYMRTDSTRIAPEALNDARKFIADNYKPEYLPEKAQIYSAKKSAQDAHEAIRPTNVFLTPESLRQSLTPEQYKLYDLIWRRFMASQMTPMLSQTTTATISASDGIFEAKGRVVLFDGHTVLSNRFIKAAKEKDTAKDEKDKDNNKDDEIENDEEQNLPRLATNDNLTKHALNSTQHFTTPPPRYSEASLVRALEKEGIGRPSTYATIVQTVQDRGYAKLVQRRFNATELGMAVTDILLANFPNVMDLQFTAKMENDLDQVEEGAQDWHKIVDDFYKPFVKKLGDAGKNAEPLRGQPSPNGEKCPLCNGETTIRYSAHGAFLGCKNYPECKGIAAMPNENVADNAGGENENGEPAEAVSCPKCGSPMLRKNSKFGNFMACGSYPACKQTLPIGKDGKIVKLPEIKMDCEKCGQPMVSKLGKNGPFLACSGYPDCKNTKHLDKEGKVIEMPDVSGEKCENCGAQMAIRMSRRGAFLGCSAFPKCRTARPMPGQEKKTKSAKPTKSTTKKVSKKKAAKNTETE